MGANDKVVKLRWTDNCKFWIRNRRRNEINYEQMFDFCNVWMVAFFFLPFLLCLFFVHLEVVKSFGNRKNGSNIALRQQNIFSNIHVHIGEKKCTFAPFLFSLGFSKSYKSQSRERKKKLARSKSQNVPNKIMTIDFRFSLPVQNAHIHFILFVC